MSQDRWIVAFPLSRAYLCVNCDFIGNCPDECPVCEGHQLLPVQKILNRQQETPDA